MAPLLLVLPLVLPLALLLAAVISQLGGSGRLSRNGIVGVRIPSTMSSDGAWRAGHHAAALPAWVGFVIISSAAILTLLLFGSSGKTVFGVIAVAAIFVVSLVWLVVAASRAARAVEIR